MSKVFTITEGLENMGAMKTGGQGSVYKGRRTGEIITAIKLLPTPIINPGPDDKNYRDFLNEVEKLKRVNEEPHPNVVTILSSGVSDTGNFPFIEMEYIEGPDLEDLVRPPHDPIFCINDICKVAEHLSNALAHCHKYEVKHGDIKSNNIKFNINTGNYVLLDFGLSVMSDEQRRTSLRRAGAIEFMAPEQNEGEIYFQTDVYSFGVILFELIAGRVPFPLNDRTESARNTVRLSHMETPVPDMVQLRSQNVPATWDEEKKERELHVPEWLLETVYKCLEKDPENRFSNGVELHDHISHARHTSAKNDEVLLSQVVYLKKMNKELVEEVEELKNLVQKKEVPFTKNIASPVGVTAVPGANEYAAFDGDAPEKRSVSRSAFLLVLFLAIVFAAIAAYSFFGKSGSNSVENTYAVGNDSTDSILQAEEVLTGDAAAENQSTESNKQIVVDENRTTLPGTNTQSTVDTLKSAAKDTTTKPSAAEATTENKEKPGSSGDRYRVMAKAYFFSQANEESRRNEFIIPSGNVVVRAIEEKGDFILVNFKDDQGETTTGWIRKKDLNKLN